MFILNTVNELLEHMKEVQSDVIELSTDSLLKMSSFIEKNSLEVDENIATSLQYQDIITQQLSANIETIESIKKSILSFNANNDIQVLQEKLGDTLQEAKEKKDRFSGKTNEHNAPIDDIEFF